MIVVMEPGFVGGGAGFVAVVDGGVGPFRGEGAVEPLDLPVGLRPVGLVRLCRMVPSAAAKSRDR